MLVGQARKVCLLRQGRIERENKSQGKCEFVDETVYEPETLGLDRIKRASNDSVNFYRFYATA